jgi:hypothetical protein
VTDFAIADESDRLAGFWPGHRMLPRRWDGYVANRKVKSSGANPVPIRQLQMVTAHAK